VDAGCLDVVRCTVPQFLKRVPKADGLVGPVILDGCGHPSVC